jgi:hypothetical protein
VYEQALEEGKPAEDWDSLVALEKGRRDAAP